MPRFSVTLTFDLLTLKMVSESRVTWATSVPILVFLSLCCRLRPDVGLRDRRQTASSLNASTLWEWKHNNKLSNAHRPMQNSLAARGQVPMTDRMGAVAGLPPPLGCAGAFQHRCKKNVPKKNKKR